MSIRIIFLFVIMPFYALSQDAEQSAMLFSVIDASTRQHITRLDSIEYISAHQQFMLTNPTTGLNFSLKDLKPTAWTECLVTVFIQGYEPSGFKTQLKPGKTRRFTIEMKPLAEVVPLDPSTVYRAMPMFPGGSNRLNCFLNDNLDLNIVSQNELAFKVVRIKFIVLPDGNLTEITFEDAYDYESINAEIFRALQQMPPWDPAVIDRKRISKEYKLSIKIPYQILECKP